MFQEHFGRIEVISDVYFTTLMFYIHFNPHKHRFVEDFRDWEWSSYGAMLSRVPTYLRRDEAMAWFGGAAGFEAFHRDAVDEARIAPLIVDDLA